MQNIDISKFKNRRIVVVGDIMLDEFIYTSCSRNSPEYKAVPILNIQDKKKYLGGAANVALNIKKLNAIPYLVGTVGNDLAGQTIYELLHKEDITNLYVHTNNRQKTTTKTRFFNDKNPIFRVDDEEDADASFLSMTTLVNHFILKNIQAAITNHKPHVIILQDYNKGVLNAEIIPEILALAKQHKMFVCVDPKFDNWNLYQDVDLFKPNEKELKVMSEELLVEDKSIENISDSGLNASMASDHSVLKSENKSDLNSQTLLKRADYLMKKINFKNLLVTLGAEGNFIFDGVHSTFNIQHSTLENADVCGAGDTVIAVASLGLACGFTLKQIAELSNKAGFIVCQKENVQPITISELEN